MRKGFKIILITLIILVIVLIAIYLTIFSLAKQKKIFINKWFVDEENSTIGVDVSSYQANINIPLLKQALYMYLHLIALALKIYLVGKIYYLYLK